MSKSNGSGRRPITRINNKGQKPNNNNPDNTKVPALIIGGALLGNLIAPGIGGAVIGGLIGGIVGNQSSDKSKGE